MFGHMKSPIKTIIARTPQVEETVISKALTAHVI